MRKLATVPTGMVNGSSKLAKNWSLAQYKATRWDAEFTCFFRPVSSRQIRSIRLNSLPPFGPTISNDPRSSRLSRSLTPADDPAYFAMLSLTQSKTSEKIAGCTLIHTLRSPSSAGHHMTCAGPIKLIGNVSGRYSVVSAILAPDSCLKSAYHSPGPLPTLTCRPRMRCLSYDPERPECPLARLPARSCRSKMYR